MILDIYPVLIGTFGLSGAAFGTLVVGALGAGATAYGANKQSKAQQAASASNAASQDKTNASAWASYLMSRGVNPNGATTGQIPTNPQAVNTRLPLWATVNRTAGGGLTSSRPTTPARTSSLGGRTWEGLGIRL